MQASSRVPLLIAPAAALLAGACTSQYGHTPVRDERGAYNAWTIDAALDSGVRSAIITQRTLYPYHFVDYSAELNEIGVRDLGVLATHLARHGGQVGLRRGGEPAALYEDRVRAVADALAAAGVDVEAVPVVDDFPGGDGMRADRVIRALESRAPAPARTETATTGAAR